MNNPEQEFITLIHENSRLIYKVCNVYSIEKEIIEDIFQDIVMNLWSAYPGFRGECKIQTWIYRVALNTCINHIRKKKRRPQNIPIIIVENIPSTSSPYSDIKELYSLLDKLSDIDKAFISLYLDNKSNEEIAEVFGISKANAAVKLHRIKEKIIKFSNE